MKTEDFNFSLPDSAIALRPARPRGASRLLVVLPDATLVDSSVAGLTAWLHPGDVMVFNTSRVLPAQLFGTIGAARIGVTLLKQLEPGRWLSFVKNAKRLKIGNHVVFDEMLTGTVQEKLPDGQIEWKFDTGDRPFLQQLETSGHMPLPPYIAGKRPADADDMTDYQTVYACEQGSVAAPTAGLHFTKAHLQTLDQFGIERIDVTLHVGAGTFLPMKTAAIEDHVMHAEWGSIDADSAAKLTAARRAGRRIVAVGTTALRMLETATDENGITHAFSGDTSIFITPGYTFKAVSGLMTNFHLPCSTLFMLVSALAGTKTMQAAYAHAIANGYKFYSYGDSSLLWLPA